MILRWCDLYTRGLSPAVAGDRRDELASDLWEHAAHEPRAGAAMISRALRGMPADLAWRHDQRRGARRELPIGTRILGGGLAAMVAAMASALIGLGVFVLVRHATFTPQRWSENEAWTLGLTLLAVAGALLVPRARTRSVGASALALSAALIHFAYLELSIFSVTANELRVLPEWGLAVWCLVGCAACIFLSAAIFWLPRLRERS